MTEKLRIAQLAPLAHPVGPDATGSIEQLIHLLTEELVRRGHAVTLFAAGDSQTSARLCMTYPRGYEHDDGLWNWQFHETLNAAAAFEQADQFDVIHSHVYHYALPFTRLVRTPVVHTYHVMPDEDIVRAYARYPEAQVVTMSHFQRSSFGALRRVDVIPHGIDTATFRFNAHPKDYLVFLGRLLPDKGAAEAIQAALRARMSLVVAGPREDEDYFHARLEPLIDGKQVQYVGAVDSRQRNELLAGASALLYPNLEGEPFGLVMIEAMACGTPVVALGVGAVPEIIEPGKTGFIAQRKSALVACIRKAVRLDRMLVRQEAVRRFDFSRMTDDYLAVYRRLARKAARR